MTQTTIDRLYHCKEPKLTWRQYRAATDLQALYQRCQFADLKALDLAKTARGVPEVHDGAQRARDEYRQLMREVGRMGEVVLFWVVIADVSCRAFSTQMGIARTDGIGALRLALTLLADLTGLPAEE